MRTVLQAAPAAELWLGPRLLLLAGTTIVAVVLQRTTHSRWLLGTAFLGILVAVWHGAFDNAVAEDLLAPHLGKRWKAPFLAGYLLLGSMMAVLWWRAPQWALPCFLVYSAWHFGTETLETATPLAAVGRLCLGGVPIAAPCLWHPGEVLPLFTAMLRSGGAAEPGAAMVHVAGQTLWPLVIGAVVAGVAVRSRASVEMPSAAPWLVLPLELALFRFCQPVVAFAVFFCVWHTPEHLLATSVNHHGRFRAELLTRHLRRGFWPWLATLALLAVVCGLGRRELVTYEAVLFVLLSALTVPHMALGELQRVMHLPKRAQHP